MLKMAEDEDEVRLSQAPRPKTSFKLRAECDELRPRVESVIKMISDAQEALEEFAEYKRRK